MARGARVPSHSSRPALSAYGTITLESDTVYILRARVVGFSSRLGAQVRFMQRMGLPEEQLEDPEVGMSDMPVPTVLREVRIHWQGPARYRKETHRVNGGSTRASKLIQYRKQLSEDGALSTESYWTSDHAE